MHVKAYSSSTLINIYTQKEEKDNSPKPTATMLVQRPILIQTSELVYPTSANHPIPIGLQITIFPLVWKSYYFYSFPNHPIPMFESHPIYIGLQITLLPFVCRSPYLCLLANHQISICLQISQFLYVNMAPNM